MPEQNSAGGKEEPQRDTTSKKLQAATEESSKQVGSDAPQKQPKERKGAQQKSAKNELQPKSTAKDNESPEKALEGKNAAPKESVKKELQAKAAATDVNKSEGVSPASKKLPPKKAYGVVPPPSFMLSEVVHEDPMFTTFQYMALTECDDRVYGYGTLSTEPTAPQGDEGMVDFDPATNRFHLIYCTELALERQNTAGAKDSKPGAHTSPGSRQRATLAARRIKIDHASDADVTVEKQSGSATGQKEGSEGGKGTGSSDLPWRLLLFGGFDQRLGDVTNDVWEFRLPPRPSSAPLMSFPSVGSWRELPVTGTKPAPRADHAVCVSAAKTRMYLFGGIGRGDSLLNDCYVLTENDKWIRLSAGTTEGTTSSPSQPAPRRCHTLTYGTASSGGATLYLFGGDLSTRGREASNELWKYSVQRNNWMRITLAAGTPPIARYDHASAFAGNKVWIGGGLSPGWIGATELKDLYGFDVTALFWFECVISLGKVQQALPRFRPLAFIPATRSFFIFGCSEHKRLQQRQAAVCALIPVCTMENLLPLQGLNANVRKGIPEIGDLSGTLKEAVQAAEKRVRPLYQKASELEEKHNLLQQKLRVLTEAKERVGALALELANSRIGAKFDDAENRCPPIESLTKAGENIGNLIEQARTVLNTKGAAADVNFLAEALEQLREEG